MATILVIDDCDSHRAEIRTALERGGDFDRVIEAGDGMAGLRLLLEQRLDAVICDLEMPGLDGEKLLRVRGANPGGPDIPFLFVTASDDLDRRARLLEDGACDAVSKPFHAADLVARLQLHLKIRALQRELEQKNERLERLSTTDALTGLRTRRYVDDVLQVEFMRAERYTSSLSVLMADLDAFKQVNDTFGHRAGDCVLRGTADRLCERLRLTDVAGRYGGEEFIVVLAHNDLDGAVVAAERWRTAIAAKPFALPDGREIAVTVSIGVSSYTPAMRSAADLVEEADRALYRAKAAGRDRVCCAGPEARSAASA